MPIQPLELIERPTRNLRRGDWVILLLAGLLLFGYCAFSGKPLTMHEGRLPQTSRQMLHEGRWLLPQSGSRPWLERPPLPHWTLITLGHITGTLDKVWIVRIPSILAATATLLLAGWSAARLLGRNLGMLAALALATMYEFYFYAGQAEDDIFLALLTAACYALFVAGEFSSQGEPKLRKEKWLGRRPWTVWAFFIVAGLSGLVKGPFMGASQVFAAGGLFILLSGDFSLWRRYLSPWGWLVFLAISLAWPLYAYSLYPSVWDNWVYDYTGPFGKQPWWYYLAAILWTMAPWTPLALVGLWKLRGPALRQPQSPQRWIFCWALAPLLLISLPARKHHHYLLPLLAGWSCLAAVGIQWLGEWLQTLPRRPNAVRWNVLLIGLPVLAGLTIAVAAGKIPGPLWAAAGVGLVFCAVVAALTWAIDRRRWNWAVAAAFVGFLFFSAWGQSVLARHDEYRTTDLEFIQRVNRIVPADQPLYIVAKDSLDFFRFEYYSRPDAQLIHNITFLRDQKIAASSVYVVARRLEEPYIQQVLGVETIEAQSLRTRAARNRDDNWTLFHITFKPDLKRYPAPAVSVLQALYRGEGEKQGPYCGPYNFAGGAAKE